MQQHLSEAELVEMLGRETWHGPDYRARLHHIFACQQCKDRLLALDLARGRRSWWARLTKQVIQWMRAALLAGAVWLVITSIFLLFED